MLLFLLYVKKDGDGSIGGSCNVTIACRDANAVCTNGRCVCKGGFNVINGVCMQNQHFGGWCNSTFPCLDSYTNCSHTGTCECVSGYQGVNGSCVQVGDVGGVCSQERQCRDQNAQCVPDGQSLCAGTPCLPGLCDCLENWRMGPGGSCRKDCTSNKCMANAVCDNNTRLCECPQPFTAVSVECIAVVVVVVKWTACVEMVTASASRAPYLLTGCALKASSFNLASTDSIVSVNPVSTDSVVSVNPVCTESGVLTLVGSVNPVNTDSVFLLGTGSPGHVNPFLHVLTRCLPVSENFIRTDSGLLARLSSVKPVSTNLGVLAQELTRAVSFKQGSIDSSEQFKPILTLVSKLNLFLLAGRCKQYSPFNTLSTECAERMRAVVTSSVFTVVRRNPDCPQAQFERCCRVHVISPGDNRTITGQPVFIVPPYGGGSSGGGGNGGTGNGPGAEICAIRASCLTEIAVYAMFIEQVRTVIVMMMIRNEHMYANKDQPNSPLTFHVFLEKGADSACVPTLMFNAVSVRCPFTNPVFTSSNGFSTLNLTNPFKGGQYSLKVEASHPQAEVMVACGNAAPPQIGPPSTACGATGAPPTAYPEEKVYCIAHVGRSVGRSVRPSVGRTVLATDLYSTVLATDLYSTVFATDLESTAFATDLERTVLKPIQHCVETDPYSNVFELDPLSTVFETDPLCTVLKTDPLSTVFETDPLSTVLN
ncbi:hypothetical protein DPMN_052028 [Dreissena polymorpha]|uniref:EGF-like domain-containing protein n=1 Tax=Dreissena polymorpha TaxID=45954 RepID=A0A9D4CL44_DREPO|nr:hypothetical protein DPMN_052028 [Dreissena polymorpha]